MRLLTMMLTMILSLLWMRMTMMMMSLTENMRLASPDVC